MLLPIGDDNRDRKLFPFVNYIFIAANVLVFVFLQGWGNDYEFTYSYALVPAEILSGDDIVTEPQIVTYPITGQRIKTPGLGETPFSVYLTFISSMFMHGSIAHLLGNMLFLFVFGDNIENRIGHFRFIIFYLLTGIAASVSHIFISVFLDANLMIPMLGASGAISGVLGGYMLLYPRRKVKVLAAYFLVEMPALLVIGLWFIFQIVESLGMFTGDPTGGGVAYAAHIGGFLAGVLVIKLFDNYRYY